MRFSKNIIRSFVDLPHKTSMIIYSIGCNLNCYGCFVYEALITHPENTITEDQIIEHIKRNGFLFDSLIISGGEFLINDLEDIKRFLLEVRRVFNGIVIINTNGTKSIKVRTLLEERLVDGIHLDLKLPPLDTIDLNVVEAVYGTSIDLFVVRKSAEAICEHNSPYSQFRTVQYPILSPEYFKQTEKFVNELNKIYRSKIEWHLNPFVDEKEAS